jgi:hypothetical protein
MLLKTIDLKINYLEIITYFSLEKYVCNYVFIMIKDLEKLINIYIIHNLIYI